MQLHIPEDQDMVVIGASGDLAGRKLLPALYNLFTEGLLPVRGKIVGYSQAQWDDEQFSAFAKEKVAEYSRVPLDETQWKEFSNRLKFLPSDKDHGIADLWPFLTETQRLIYLAVPPSAFRGIVEGIDASGMAEGTRLIIEKPFGHDLSSARALNVMLHNVLPEERIFRIDHYLGKETVQNLLVFRFGNTIFEKVWNRDSIERVEITVAESIGVENRGNLYEEMGAVRDIVQNHLFQLLALVAMEPPVSLSPEAIRNEKVKVLQAVQTVDPSSVVRGQYTAGSIDGNRVRGYREEEGVSPRSNTETFVAMRIGLGSWRWSGVPFLLRTGKRMATRDTRITVVFREPPTRFFESAGLEHIRSNRLVIRIQPDEGMALTFIAKEPGPEVDVRAVRMNFTYGDSFKTSPHEAYERLLHDALVNDPSLFIREDEVEQGWKIVQPVLDHPGPAFGYQAGSWGPEEAVGIPWPSRWTNIAS